MDEATQNQLRQDWEKRAAEQGLQLSGVLLRNLPAPLNEYLHQQHIQVIEKWLLPKLPESGLLLDVGSGYGRMSADILKGRPDLNLIGLDFSQTFCHLYTKHVNMPAVCASLYDLPFEEEIADGVIAITALMYIEETQAGQVLNKLIQRIKPNGYALILDPSKEYLDVLKRFRNDRTVTSGLSFTQNEYLGLVANCVNVEIEAVGGFPIFSAFLPILYGVANWPRILNYLLLFVRRLDQALGSWNQFTLHRWILLRRC